MCSQKRLQRSPEKLRGRKGAKMSAVLDLAKQSEKRETRAKSYSIVDMILDPAKKKEADDYYNDQHEYVEKDDFAKKLFGKNKNKK